MGVKISDRQSFHFCEHGVTHISQSTLADVDHDPVVDIGGCHTDSIKTGYTSNGHGQRAKIRIVCMQQRDDVLVDQSFCKHGSLNIGQNTGQNTD